MTAMVEMDPETLAHRQHRRMIWQTIRLRYAEAVADAMSSGVGDEDARKAGARAVRGDLRALMSELLARAPVPAVLGFLSEGQDWGQAGERILGRSDAVSELVESVYPHQTWTMLEFLDHAAAADDARWSAWTHAWVEALCAVSPAARTTLLGSQPPAEQKDAKSSTALKRWAPWLASAAAIVGVTAAVAVATRE
jgi:hypothetical protein